MQSETLYNRILRGIFILVLLISMGPYAYCQEKVIIIDTTDYLPFPEGLNTNLMIAAAKGYTSEVHRLVKLGADIDAVDYYNISPLIYAVANNNITTVKALLDYNPDTEMLTNGSESALHIAAKDNLIEIAEALIRADADINLKDKYGATPLHYASAYGYFYMCDLLIYYNASIDDRTEDGNTPLITAVFAGQADISDLLLQSGASPDTPDNKGFTPLMVAAQNNDTLLIGLLLDAGCELNAINTYKYDALGLAIRNNNYKAYKYLINSLKPADYKNNNIISPVLIARKYGRTEILEELKESGFTEPPRLNFDHVKINAGIKASFRDYYTRLGISIKEPLLKLMLNAGFELKPMYSKVLVKYSSDSFYQYFDKRYVLFAGAGKEFKLYEDFRKGNFSLDINLNVGYMMSSQYRGTYIKPPDKLRIMPQTVIRWNRGKINVYAGYEFMKTDLYRIGPSWFTLGVYYDIYFDKMRSPIKTIKWY